MFNDKDQNFVSVIIYIHNNQDTIPVFLQSLNSILSQNFEKYEIIFINDDSSDLSVYRIREYAHSNSQAIVSLLNMSFYQGLELSMNAGMDLAIGDFVYEFDRVDMDYEPELIMSIYHRSLQGFDIVSAAPKTTKNNASRLFYSVFNRSTSHPLRSESFRILSRRAINRVHAMSVSVPYRKAVYSNCGLKIDSISYDNKNLMISVDREIKQKNADVAISALIIYTNIAYRISMLLSLLMIFAAMSIGVYTIIIYFGGSNPVEGWTTTMLFLSLGFFGVFAMFTIVIKYLSVLIQLVFNRQKYVVESIEKISAQ